MAAKVVAGGGSPAEKTRAKAMLENEARALARVRHPHVVQLLGICTDCDSPMMLLTLAAGTLQTELEQQGPALAMLSTARRVVLVGAISFISVAVAALLLVEHSILL